MRILAGDIGGTHTRLAYLCQEHSLSIRHEKRYASTDYPGIVPIVNDFLSCYAIENRFDVVCLAVAGPVLSGSVSTTNLPWYLSEEMLGAQLHTKKVCLINDLVAVAYAIPNLPDSELILVQPEEAESVASLPQNAAVVAAGTGLGAAHLVWQEGRYLAYASEAGHAGFAPQTEIQVRLLSWLQQQHAHVSVEMLLSGRGIQTLYHFFRDELGLPESGELNAAMCHSDPAQVISARALEGKDELCIQTMACFVAIYGAVAGDIVLHYYPIDAVYLAGGIGPKIRPLLGSRVFREAFANKGPMHRNLQRLPVKLILTDEPGLEGAIAQARQWVVAHRDNP